MKPKYIWQVRRKQANPAGRIGQAAVWMNQGFYHSYEAACKALPLYAECREATCLGHRLVVERPSAFNPLHIVPLFYPHQVLDTQQEMEA